jgi:hypothetical protein
MAHLDRFAKSLTDWMWFLKNPPGNGIEGKAGKISKFQRRSYTHKPEFKEIKKNT